MDPLHPEHLVYPLYTYLQSVQSYIAPPIAAVFILGLAWRRINANGALTTLLVGFVLGATRLVLELVNGTDKTGLASGTIWKAIAEFNFLHFAIILFVIEQAKGVLAERHAVDVATAFDMMRRHARNHRRSLREVCHAVIDRGLALECGPPT